MDEPALTIYRQEYTPPEAFPARMNGAWHSEAAYPIARTKLRTLLLGAGTLEASTTDHRPPTTDDRQPALYGGPSVAAASTPASEEQHGGDPAILNSSFSIQPTTTPTAQPTAPARRCAGVGAARPTG